MEEVTVVGGLPAIESEPVTSAEGDVGWALVAGAPTIEGSNEEDPVGAEGLPAIKRQPAAAPMTRIASAARTATSR